MKSAVAGVVEEIEHRLASRYGRRYCVLANRGTTALTAALHALDRPGARAIFPAAMCSIPVYAARFAGWKPDFADVDPEDGNFAIHDVERALRGGDVGAVIPVHMFGKVDDVNALWANCRRYGADLIEDAALSMGAVRDGRPAGSFGRIACFSFVRKMLPLEMGGAVMTDEPALDRRARAFLSALPAQVPARRDEAGAALRAFHSLTGFVAAGDWRRTGLFAGWDAEFHRLLLGSTNESDWRESIVLEELEKLDDVLQARRVRAEVYESALDHPALRHMDRTGSSLFAYPVRLVGLSAEDFLQFAAGRGHRFARVAYPDVHAIFAPRRVFPGAAVVEREVIGLPLDEHEPVSAFWSYAAEFRGALDDYLKVWPARRAIDERGRLEMRMGGLPG